MTKRKPYSADDLKLIAAKTTLNTHEAAVIAGISNATLWARMKAGDGPVSFKIAGRRLIARKDLDSWIDARKCEARRR